MPKTYTLPPTEAIGKENLNNDAFYKLVMNGSAHGQAVVNVFYYRVGLGLLPGGLNFGGAEALAYAFKNQFWTDSLITAFPLAYTLQNITVYPYNGDFDPSVQLPYTLPVDENGIAAGATPSTASVVIAKFNLEGVALGVNGMFPPKRGYMAFGPSREGDADDSGRLTTGARDFYADKFACLAQDLVNLVSLVTYWPIRISARTIAGIYTLRGFADISGVTIRPVLSWRDSRKLEA